MRKTLFLATFIFLIVNFVSAQSSRLGVFAGPVAANMFQKVGGVKHNTDYGVGATIGVLLDVPMQKRGSFQPGLNYVGKNSKDEFEQGGSIIKTETMLHYIELPLNVIFRLPKGDGNFTLGGGVAAAVAIDGSRTSSINTDKEELNFGDETTDDFGKYDFGINALAGYEFKNGFFLQLNYNHGINRLFVGGDPEDKLYNRYFALRVGLFIGGKK
ncbi:MAG: porin family protein [Chitinophagales bacterium]